MKSIKINKETLTETIMVFLKGDGSLDITRIKRLNPIDRIEMISEMTEKQLELYFSTFRINECETRSLKPISVDFGFDDPRSGVDAFEFLDKMKEEFSY